MNKVYVLFHNPKDDKAGKLNECLESKDALVSLEKKVVPVAVPDGWLIVCYDEVPGEQVKQVIREKTTGTQPPPQQILIVHKTSWKNNANLQAAQQDLTSRGNVLSKAGRIASYSHETGDSVYENVIALLSKGLPQGLLPALKESKKKTLAGDFSKLKHSIGCILSALDIDLQGLVAAEFNSEYKREVAEAYQAELKMQSAGLGRQGGVSTYVDLRDEMLSGNARIPASGKATGFLEQARGMIHADSSSIKTLKEEVLQATGINTEPGRDIESKWSEVEKLLPEDGCKPDEIYEILRRMETVEGLDELANQFGPNHAWDKIFHEWFYSLDDALNRLRDTMSAALLKAPVAQQSDTSNKL
jgi:hypothetical protein